MTGSGAIVVVDGYVVVVDCGGAVCGDVVGVGALEVEAMTVDVVLVVCWMLLGGAIIAAIVVGGG